MRLECYSSLITCRWGGDVKEGAEQHVICACAEFVERGAAAKHGVFGGLLREMTVNNGAPLPGVFWFEMK